MVSQGGLYFCRPNPVLTANISSFSPEGQGSPDHSFLRAPSCPLWLKVFCFSDYARSRRLRRFSPAFLQIRIPVHIFSPHPPTAVSKILVTCRFALTWTVEDN